MADTTTDLRGVAEINTISALQRRNRMRPWARQWQRLSGVILIVLWATVSGCPGGTYSGGTGTAGDPYQLATAADWQELIGSSGDWGDQFVVTDDIDLSGISPFEPVARDTDLLATGFQGTAFSGKLDGNGHVLSNATITISGVSNPYYIGLVGQLDPCGIIVGLTLDNADVSGSFYVGGLVGIGYGRIESCAFSGAVSGINQVGGLAGELATEGEIIGCRADGTVDSSTTPSNHLGGIVGKGHGVVSECEAANTVNGRDYSGGIVGTLDGTVERCYSHGEVEGEDLVGGVVGFNSGGTVTVSYSLGLVTATGAYGGGVAGYNTGIVDQCYATGVVSADEYPGGVVGRNTGTVTACLWDTQTTGQSGSQGGTGKTTAEMMQLVTFTSESWDFDDGDGDPADWWMIDGCCYPKLAWQGPYSGGDGSAANPYQLASGCDWWELTQQSDDWDAHFVVTADIDLADATGLTPVGNAPSPHFTGTLDGGGHQIANATIDQDSSDHVGLLGYMGTGSEVRDLGVGNITVIGANYVGGLVGRNWTGTIEGCYVTGLVSGSGYYVGGLTAMNDGTISDCYANASVSGYEYVGGLTGVNSGSGSLVRCYSLGPVSLDGSDYAGGLVANNQRTIEGCFWNTGSSGIEGSFGGKGLTGTEMMTVSIFQNAGWGDSGQWVMSDGVSPPRLVWEATGDPAIPTAGPVPLSGSGTNGDPYQLWTAGDVALLSWYSAVLDSHLRVMGDIDLAGEALWPIGDLGPFTGVFDGNGFTLSNPTITQPDNHYIALVGQLGSMGEINDVTLENATISGGHHVGMLVGWSRDGSINRCTVQGTVAGGNHRSGGLVGLNDGGTVIASCATGAVSGDDYVGGLVGNNSFGDVEDSYAGCSVDGARYVGGLVGSSTGTVNRSYATGGVIGNHYAGGFMGYNYNGTLTGCFWDTQATGLTDGVGNEDPDPAGAMGRTTAEMRQQGTFTGMGWDFLGETANGTEDTWRLCEDGVDYPRFSRDHDSLADWYCPDGGDLVDFAHLGDWWNTSGCVGPADCGGGDVDRNGTVDLGDLAVMAEHWLGS